MVPQTIKANIGAISEIGYRGQTAIYPKLSKDEFPSLSTDVNLVTITEALTKMGLLSSKMQTWKANKNIKIEFLSEQS